MRGRKKEREREKGEFRSWFVEEKGWKEGRGLCR